MLIKILLLLPGLALLFLPFDYAASSVALQLIKGRIVHLVIFFPALLVYQSTIYCFPFEPSAMKILKIQGLLAIFFAIASTVNMYELATNYGAGRSEEKPTIIFYMIPVYILAFAVWSILLSEASRLNSLGKILFKSCQ